MNEEFYIRQEALGIRTDQRVAIVGCGGVGSWVAYFLALAGIDSIALYDGDTVEGHNLHRLPLTPREIGMRKSEAVAQLLQNARPMIHVTPRLHFDPTVHTLADFDVVVCSTDSLKSRQMVLAAAAQASCYYYEAGADGERCSISGPSESWETPLEGDTGYAHVPVFVGPCTMAASMIAYYVLKGQ